MLVVLVIVGILASMAIPKFQAFAVNQEVESTAYELTQSMEAARVTAQSYGRDVKICPVTLAQLNTPLPNCDASLSSSEPWQAWVVFDLINGIPNRVLSRSQAISHTIVVNGNANDGQVINSQGRAVFSGFTIKIRALQSEDVEKTIKFAPSGRVTLL